MINKDELQAKLNQDYEELLNDVEFHIEGLKFDFAEEVSKYLEEEGVTRAELARKMGTSPAWITKMLRTNWNMTMETMAKLAFALEMKVVPKLVRLGEPDVEWRYHEEFCWERKPKGFMKAKLPAEDIPEEPDYQVLPDEIDIAILSSLEEQKKEPVQGNAA
jgi:transcriptional regulator with XRE-family HTH domain